MMFILLFELLQISENVWNVTAYKVHDIEWNSKSVDWCKSTVFILSLCIGIFAFWQLACHIFFPLFAIVTSQITNWVSGTIWLWRTWNAPFIPPFWPICITSTATKGSFVSVMPQNSPFCQIRIWEKTKLYFCNHQEISGRISPDSTVYLIFHIDRMVGMILLVIGGTRVLVSQILGRLSQRLYGFDASFPFGHRS